MKQILKIIGVFSALLITATNASAYDYKEDGICYDLDKENHTATVVGINTTHEGVLDFDSSDELNTELHIVIPSSIFYIGEEFVEYKVTGIGYGAFSGNKDLTSIVISNGVTHINERAFQGCTNLKSISIPASVTMGIARNTFYDCGNSLETIIVDSDNPVFNDGKGSNCIIRTGDNTLILGCKNTTIPEEVVTIRDEAFHGVPSLLYIPSSVRKIETKWCAAGMEDIQFISVDSNNSVYNDGNGSNCIIQTADSTLVFGCKTTIIPYWVTGIASYAFYGCTGLASISIPENVTEIGSCAFYGCTGLTSITIPENVTAIKDNVFEGCTSLATIMIPENVTEIGSSAFYGCTGLASISIPENVTEIGSRAFYGCTGLTSITIPEKVTSIGSRAFQGCTGLTSITVPNSVVFIKENAFRNCSCSIICLNDFPPKAAINTFNSNMTAYVPASALEAYLNAEGWNVMEIKEATPEMIGISEIDVTATAGPSHLLVKGGYDSTNLSVTEFGFEGYEPFEDELEVYGLDPDTEYTFTFYVVTTEAGKQTKDFTFKTSTLTMVPLSPKVVSVGNAIVAAQTNLADEEKNIGFEWRAEGWSDIHDSHYGQAILYDGMIEGSLHDLHLNDTWKFRPYYKSDAGNYYYGAWKGVDPNDISYFDPVVHTSRKVNVMKNTASVSGNVISGSNQISTQGMKYWKASEDGDDTMKIFNADAVEAKSIGQDIAVDITDLEFGTTYNFAAFVITSDGKTYYGETRLFTTEPSPADVNRDGIVDISDIVAVINHIAGTNTYKQADVNGDTNVDISDIVAIINNIAAK